MTISESIVEEIWRNPLQIYVRAVQCCCCQQTGNKQAHQPQPPLSASLAPFLDGSAGIWGVHPIYLLSCGAQSVTGCCRTAGRDRAACCTVLCQNLQEAPDVTSDDDSDEEP